MQLTGDTEDENLVMPRSCLALAPLSPRCASLRLTAALLS